MSNIFIYLNSCCCTILVFPFYVFIVTVSFSPTLGSFRFTECTVARLHMTQLPSVVHSWTCVIKCMDL